MDEAAAVRIDKWLWAARFFKTRSLATDAVTGGHVHLNGQRVKPARPVRVGDRVEVVRGHSRMEVTVDALSERRGPAKIAATLYSETQASRVARETAAAQRRVARQSAPAPERRPDKKARRQIRRFSGRD
jgi:ribosome-associated heat shock protein Hsp15